MVQLTYYAPRETEPEPAWEPPADVHSLRFGYNLADIDVFAKAACRRAYAARALEFRYRYETAWSAIAHALYTSDAPPAPDELVATGAHAINDEARAQRHLAGISDQTWQPAPGYERYWIGSARVTPSPESRIVDRLALWQIWEQLSDRHRTVLKAQAAFPDPDQAAASLEVGYGTYTDWLSQGRRAFLQAWHQGEKPSRLWRHSRRQRRDGKGYNGRPRITESELERIRDRRAAGETVTAIAADYEVGKSWLSKLLRGTHSPAPDSENDGHRCGREGHRPLGVLNGGSAGSVGAASLEADHWRCA